MKIIFGGVMAFFTFLSIGIPIGFLAFYLIKKQELYFYNNLGFTKWKLFKTAFFINLLVGTPVLLFILITLTFLFGDSRLI